MEDTEAPCGLLLLQVDRDRLLKDGRALWIASSTSISNDGTSSCNKMILEKLLIFANL